MSRTIARPGMSLGMTSPLIARTRHLMGRRRVTGECDAGDLAVFLPVGELVTVDAFTGSVENSAVAMGSKGLDALLLMFGVLLAHEGSPNSLPSALEEIEHQFMPSTCRKLKTMSDAAVVALPVTATRIAPPSLAVMRDGASSAPTALPD